MHMTNKKDQEEPPNFTWSGLIFLIAFFGMYYVIICTCPM